MVFRSITKIFKTYGWRGGALYAVANLVRRISGGKARIVRYFLVAQPVPDAPAELATRRSNSTVREVGPTDSIVAQFPRPKEVIDARFKTGARCFVAEIKGRFAGYLWLAFEGYEEDEVRCRYEFRAPEICVWDFDVYVAPEFRLGRTFGRLWDTVNNELAGQGVRWTCSRIAALSRRSLAAHRRLGMVKLHTATFICLSKLQIAMISMKPYVHVSWRQGSRPVIALPIPICAEDNK